jgi:hypothetical protein
MKNKSMKTTVINKNFNKSMKNKNFNKSMKNDSILNSQPENLIMKGGSNVTFDELIGLFTDKLKDDANIKKRMIQFYQIKRGKYEKEIKRRSSSIDANLIVDIATKNKVLGAISANTKRSPALGESYTNQVHNERDTIEEILRDQRLVEKYNQIMTVIDAKITRFNADDGVVFIKGQWGKMVDLFRELDTDNVNIIRVQILEYLVGILNGNILLDTFQPFNMTFLGAAGIGKSTNADRVAELFQASLILAIGKVNQVTKPDIIGQYIGHTTPLVYKKLSDSLESVVFLDEAYSIAGQKRGDSGFDAFGKEAIDAIVEFSSRHQGLLSFIAAGYAPEMETQFFEVNPGLPRRFPTSIYLQRYNLKEIIGITKNVSTKQLNSFLDNQIDNKDEYKRACDIGKYLFIIYIIKLNLLFNYTIYPSITKNYDKDITDLHDEINSNKIIDLINTDKHNTNTLIGNIPKSNMGVYIRMKNFSGEIMDYPLLIINIDQTATNIKRKPFGLDADENDISWFFLVYILKNITNIPNGDLFNFQAADIKSYTEQMLNTYLLGPVSEIVDALKTEGKKTRSSDDLKIDFELFVTNIFKEKGSKLTVVNDNDTNMQKFIFDNQENNLLGLINLCLSENPDEMNKFKDTNDDKIQDFRVLFYYFKENVFQNLISIKNEDISRDYTIFTLTQIRNMDKSANKFNVELESFKGEQVSSYDGPAAADDRSVNKKSVNKLLTDIRDMLGDPVVDPVESATTAPINQLQQRTSVFTSDAPSSQVNEPGIWDNVGFGDFAKFAKPAKSDVSAPVSNDDKIMYLKDTDGKQAFIRYNLNDKMDIIKKKINEIIPNTHKVIKLEITDNNKVTEYTFGFGNIPEPVKEGFTKSTESNPVLVTTVPSQVTTAQGQPQGLNAFAQSGMKFGLQ